MKRQIAGALIILGMFAGTSAYAQTLPPTPPPSSPTPTPPPPAAIEKIVAKSIDASAYYYSTATCRQMTASVYANQYEETSSVNGGFGSLSFQLSVSIYDTCRRQQIASGWGYGMPTAIKIDFENATVYGTVSFVDYVTNQLRVVEVQVDWNPTRKVSATWNYRDNVRDETRDVASQSVGRRGAAKAKGFISDGVNTYADGTDLSALLSEFTAHETITQLTPAK